MKELVLSDHARYQMRERNITQENVAGAVSDPDKVVQQEDGRTRALKRFTKDETDYALVVIYEETQKQHDVVITAFITSKIQKYL